MKKIWLLFFVLFASLWLFGCSQTTTTQETPTTQTSNVSDNQISSQYQSKIQPDKIEIILFHATNRCYSCNTMEAFMKKTLEENFKDEYKNGEITFQEINWELPENRDIVIKYNAQWLSVFVNTITDWKDNIQEESTAWRLISDENQFKEYMTKKLKWLLWK